jgi:hypothetical protein
VQKALRRYAGTPARAPGFALLFSLSELMLLTMLGFLVVRHLS